MKILWSIVLLIAISLSICTAYFFGHALSVHEKAKWFGISAICFVLSVGLLFAIVRYDRHTPDATHRH